MLGPASPQKPAEAPLPPAVPTPGDRRPLSSAHVRPAHETHGGSLRPPAPNPPDTRPTAPPPRLWALLCPWPPAWLALLMTRRPSPRPGRPGAGEASLPGLPITLHRGPCPRTGRPQRAPESCFLAHHPQEGGSYPHGLLSRAPSRIQKTSSQAPPPPQALPTPPSAPLSVCLLLNCR